MMVSEGSQAVDTALLVVPSEASSSSSIEPRKSSYLFDYDWDFDVRTKQKPPVHLSAEADKRLKAVKAPKLPPAFQSQGQVKLLNTLQLVGLTFFCVTGGPFGFEETVQTGGAVLMLLGLFLYPFLWSAPLALMTAELSCMIPESGGHVLWVYRALGPFCVLDNALYPVLFVEYLSALLYDEDTHHISFGWSVLLKVMVLVLASALNILGIGLVGKAAIVLGCLVLAPFFSMIILGLPYLNFDWARGPLPKKIDWGKFFTVLLWNTSGFDAAGTCAAEVKNPSHSYPRALAASVMLISAVFSMPTVIGVSVIPNFTDWKNGTYMRAAKFIGGKGLKVWMGLSEVFSALGLLLVRLCTNSRIIYGMSQVEQVPSMFSKLHPTYRTPYKAILLTSGCTLLLIGFSAISLAEADMLFYALSTIIKFCSLVQLRYTEPDAFRPFRIPLDDQALFAFAAIPIFICTTMIYLASDHAQVIGLLGSVIGIFGYIAKELLMQFGTEAEEVVQQRMAKVQQNIEKMQSRIDNVVAMEFKAPLNQLGSAFRAGAPHGRAGGGEDLNQAAAGISIQDTPSRYIISISFVIPLAGLELRLSSSTRNFLCLKEWSPPWMWRKFARVLTLQCWLDHNWALGQISERTGFQVLDVKSVIIWGNHSSTQYLDVSHAVVITPKGEKPVREVETIW
ncbi:hypothetical protein SELMODRAFT_430321 [Selaginella moellendorffii]|uniref:Uncharacterized protein LAT4.2 n=1 Tax=Selaginella moellendorffii TaxID=88036 RepID=D8T913_SELML|nr:hypothetical protein SELMODRAFT_430321 [Selaginella moellendorffii]